jgi:hypothetical protein
MRVRANGDKLTWNGLEADILYGSDSNNGRVAWAHEIRRDAQELGRQEWDEGVHLGARIEHKVALEAVANALLEILGKDAGDGIINLGAAGTWGKSSGRWKQRVEASYDYREGLSPASK